MRTKSPQILKSNHMVDDSAAVFSPQSEGGDKHALYRLMRVAGTHHHEAVAQLELLFLAKGIIPKIICRQKEVYRPLKHLVFCQDKLPLPVPASCGTHPTKSGPQMVRGIPQHAPHFPAAVGAACLTSVDFQWFTENYPSPVNHSRFFAASDVN